MQRYKLIKQHPGSPEKGTTVEVYKNYFVTTSPCGNRVESSKHKGMGRAYNKEDFKNFPEFWQETQESKYKIINMKKYKLIKEYPDSHKIGTVFESTDEEGGYVIRDSKGGITAYSIRIFVNSNGEKVKRKEKTMFEEFPEFFEEMIENETELEKLIQMAKDVGVVPINAEKQNEHKITLLFDINMLPSEYSIKDYEKEYNVRLIPYDGSKVNIRGQMGGIGIQKI